MFFLKHNIHRTFIRHVSHLDAGVLGDIACSIRYSSCFEKHMKLILLKWFLSYSNWLNSSVICKNSLLTADTDVVCQSDLGPLWCHLRYIFKYNLLNH